MLVNEANVAYLMEQVRRQNFEDCTRQRDALRSRSAAAMFNSPFYFQPRWPVNMTRVMRLRRSRMQLLGSNEHDPHASLGYSDLEGQFFNLVSS